MKVVSFRVGDLVTIINDAHKVQQLQKGHGEWIDIMRYVSSNKIYIYITFNFNKNSCIP